MRKPASISAILPPTRAKVLAPMVMNPKKAWFQTELARHLGVRHTTIQRELAFLARTGVLISWRDGGRRYYQADDSTPVFPELSRLLLKTVGLVDLLKQLLQPLEDRIDTAFIFGSLAAETDTARSDVDLFVVGKVGLVELSPFLTKAEERLLRPVNPVVYSRQEFLRRVRASDHFVTSVLAKPKLFVLGMLDDIMGEAGGTRSRHTAKDE